MSKLTLDLKKCLTYYGPFVDPSVSIYRDRKNDSWLYVCGTTSDGILYAYRLHGSKDIEDCMKQKANKQVSEYKIDMKYNTVELRVGTFYRMDELIDELGDLTMRDELIPTYDTEGYRILHYSGTEVNMSPRMKVYATGITRDDDVAGSIISALTVWNNNICITNNSWNAKPNAWSAHGETFNGQMIEMMRFIMMVEDDQEIDTIQENIIAKLITSIICNIHSGNYVRRYRKLVKTNMSGYNVDDDLFDEGMCF